MRRITKPTWLLTTGLLVVLAATGLAYGLWAETLTLDGVVHTGTVDASYSLVEIDQMADFNDNCPLGGFSIGQDCDLDGLLNDDMEAEGKDIAECDAELDATGNMTVTVTSAYPLYNCFVKYDIHNLGTLPIHAYGPAYFYDGVFQGSAINTNELHVNGWPPIGCPTYDEYVQLEPGEEFFCTLHLNLRQDAEMGATYTFQLQNFARQWNEIVAPPYLP